MKQRGIDLLNGDIFRSLSLLAIPIMATFMIQMAYNLIDMIWIGYVGANAVASIGAAGMYMWLSNGLVTMPKIGGQIYLAQSLGQRDEQSGKAYVRGSLQMTLVFGLIFGLVVMLFTKPLIAFFNLSDPQVVLDAQNYLFITSGLIVFSFVNQTFTGLFTAMGNSKTTFIATVSGLVLNIILDPLLIFGFGFIPAFGVLGAAIATVIAQAVVSLVFIYVAMREPLFMNLRLLGKVDFSLQRKLVKIGFPTAVQSMLFTGISMLIARMIAGFGDQAVAVQKVGSQIESISWMIADGFSASLNAFIAQNYGAGNISRVREGYKVGMKVVGIWGIFCTALLMLCAGDIFQIFIHEAEILPLGVDYLWILGISQLFMCVEIATQGAFSGLGKTLPPSIVSIVFTVARIPMAVFLSRQLGLNGIWWAITISSILKGCILFVWYIFHVRKQFATS